MLHQEFDMVVLGGGSGGYAAALRGAQLGLSVALVEESLLGGTCLHSGCVPTKALLHAAEIAEATRSAEQVGVKARYEGIDVGRLHQYRQGVIDRLHKGLKGLVSSRKVTLVAGRGRLEPDRSVVIDGTRYTGTKAVVLATGSYARALPTVAATGRILTSTEALALDDIPKSVVVIGGGVIGSEFASMWRSLGAEVSIVEALPSLLPSEDESVRKGIERAYRQRGIGLHLGVQVQAVIQHKTGVEVTLESGESLRADYILLAVGRGPRTQDVGYEEAGVQLDKGFVVVDDDLRTTVPGIYAVGDIVPGLQLAHRGFQQGIFVAETVAGLNPVRVAESCIPRITYSEPEAASVGLTEAAARSDFGDSSVEVVEYNLAGNGKSQILGTSGFVKLVRRVDGPVVGVHMLGTRVGELIGEAQLAVAWEAHPDDVAPHLHGHPSQNEAMGEAFMMLAGKPLHAHA